MANLVVAGQAQQGGPARPWGYHTVAADEQLLGQGRVRRLLGAALRRGRLPQALILAGPAGIGKRAAARLLAAAMLCPHPAADGWGCGHCRSCRAVTAGTHPDLHWLEAEGQQKITLDQVRPWHSEVSSLTPAWGSRVVGVVVPAEELTEAAQNSLLKVIEEPPTPVTWLLLSANPAALLPTIRSRCWQVQLDGVATPVLKDWLVQSHQVEEGRAERVARLAAGRPGVALCWIEDPAMETSRQEVAELLLSLGQGRWVELVERAQVWSEEEKEGLARRLQLLALGWRDQVALAKGSSPVPLRRDQATPVCPAELALYFPELVAQASDRSPAQPARLLEVATRALALARSLAVWGNVRLQLEALLLEAEAAWEGYQVV